VRTLQSSALGRMSPGTPYFCNFPIPTSFNAVSSLPGPFSSNSASREYPLQSLLTIRPLLSSQRFNFYLRPSPLLCFWTRDLKSDALIVSYCRCGTRISANPRQTLFLHIQKPYQDGRNSSPALLYKGLQYFCSLLCPASCLFPFFCRK